MNATLAKFGYPGTLLNESEHWCVLMRPQQVTLGALVLAARSEANAMSLLPPAAFTELSAVTKRIEQSLARFRPYGKINYICLMMVDPHVHFHVLPRYAAAQDFGGVSFPDPGWPGVPDLKQAPQLTDPQRSTLHGALLDAFRASG